MIIPCNFSIFDTMIWVLATGSPINIYNSLQELQVSRRFGDDKRFLNVRDGRLVLVLALKIIKLVIDSHSIVLSDCHFCRSFLLNIIFIGLLAKSNYEILIKVNFCDIILNGVIMMHGQLNNDIYVVSRPNIIYVSNKCLRIVDVTDAYL